MLKWIIKIFKENRKSKRTIEKWEKYLDHDLKISMSNKINKILKKIETESIGYGNNMKMIFFKKLIDSLKKEIKKF